MRVYLVELIETEMSKVYHSSFKAVSEAHPPNTPRTKLMALSQELRDTGGISVVAGDEYLGCITATVLI